MNKGNVLYVLGVVCFFTFACLTTIFTEPLEPDYIKNNREKHYEQKLLDDILDNIIEENMTTEEKALAIHNWTNSTIKHDKIPLYGTAQNFNVTKILKVKDADCGGHTAVMLALFTRLDIPVRAIQTHDHMVAEVYFDEDWHVLDADPVAYGGVIQRDENGIIMNACELYSFFDVGRVTDIGFEILSSESICR